MEWVEPQYSRQAVNHAWAVYRHLRRLDNWTVEQYDEYENVLRIINNWRQSHSYPLNAIQVNLRNHARKVDPGFLVAQRLKRFSSIESKLFRLSDMKLSQMQDIGGCRAVVDTIKEVQQLHDSYIVSRSHHLLSTTDDYIANPKNDGYRGIHLVYKYQSNVEHRQVYNDLKIEIQLRSRFQHAWATAVEVVGTMVNEALKVDEGDADWLRFFSLMGAIISVREKAPHVPNTPDDPQELIREIDYYERRLDVMRRLRDYSNGIRTTEDSAAGAVIFVMVSNLSTNEMTVSGYTRQHLADAIHDLEYYERISGKPDHLDVVLVSVASLAELKRAYPNYYADTNLFLRLLRNDLKRYRTQIRRRRRRRSR